LHNVAPALKSGASASAAAAAAAVPSTVLGGGDEGARVKDTNQREQDQGHPHRTNLDRKR